MISGQLQKFKKHILKISIVTCASLFVLGGTSAFAKNFGNKYEMAWTNETAQIHYSGGVFFYPKRTGDRQAFAKYTRSGKTIDYGWTGYLPYPSGWSKNKKVTATVSCWDSLGWNAPKTTFHYGWSKNSKL